MQQICRLLPRDLYTLRCVLLTTYLCGTSRTPAPTFFTAQCHGATNLQTSPSRPIYSNVSFFADVFLRAVEDARPYIALSLDIKFANSSAREQHLASYVILSERRESKDIPFVICNLMCFLLRVFLLRVVAMQQVCNLLPRDLYTLTYLFSTTYHTPP